MEGVGARLGRSSTRYGPATVFTGPVRKWKKKWVHVPPSNSTAASNSSSAAINSGHNLNGSTTAAAAAASGGNASHLVLYKWTPITQSGNTNGGGGGGGNNNNNNIGSNGVDKSSMNSDPATEEPPRRRFKYIPIALLEEEKDEDEDVEINAAEDVDDEGKPSENDLNSVEPNNNSGGSDEKPDINNMPMEVSEDDNKGVRQDLNESTLDLSLSFKAGDGNHDD